VTGFAQPQRAPVTLLVFDQDALQRLAARLAQVPGTRLRGRSWRMVNC
jgi:hypothetical protein